LKHIQYAESLAVEKVFHYIRFVCKEKKKSLAHEILRKVIFFHFSEIKFVLFFVVVLKFLSAGAKRGGGGRGAAARCGEKGVRHSRMLYSTYFAYLLLHYSTHIRISK
jgi:hypothetical protein